VRVSAAAGAAVVTEPAVSAAAARAARAWRRLNIGLYMIGLRGAV